LPEESADITWENEKELSSSVLYQFSIDEALDKLSKKYRVKGDRTTFV
jgi:hypothetical protein